MFSIAITLGNYEGSVVHPSKYVFSFYLISGAFLFAKIGWITSYMLRSLRQQGSIDLERSQRCYVHIETLVDEMSRCFGPYLMVIVIMFFSWNINGSFYLVVSFSENGADPKILVACVMQFSLLMVFFFLLCIPNRIKREV